MKFFKRLFHPNAQTRDGLTQPQREAIVDLLNYCSMVDHDVTFNEETFIDGLESQFDWDPNTDFEYYMDKSIGSVRRALESKDEPFFLQQIRSRLQSGTSRDVAKNLSRKLFQSDGKETPEGNATLAAIEKAMA
jgi:hypothetical protein